MSYVVRGRTAEEPIRGDEAADFSHVDRAGVDRVLAHEVLAGRRPVELEHSNPGFDVESFDDDGRLLRRIEIKSTDGAWGERGVAVSSRQYAQNREDGELFWLYVVEFATDDARAAVHRVQDPAQLAGAYVFDDGWRVAAEPTFSGLPPQRVASTETTAVLD